MIELTSNVVRYNGNNSTTDFDYPFRIFADTDLLVFVDGVLQTLSTDYNVTGVDLDEGGSVSFVTAPPTGNSNVVFERSVPYTQPIAIPEGSKFPVHLVETGMDRIVVQVQQLLDTDERSFSIASYATTGLEDFTLTEDADERAGRVLAFTNDGMGMTVGPTVAELESLLEETSLLEIPANRLRGRGSANGTGPVENITLGNGLSLNGTVLEAQSGQPTQAEHERFEGYTVGLRFEAGPVMNSENKDSLRLFDCQYLVTTGGRIVTPRRNLTLDFATEGANGRDRADALNSGHRWWAVNYIFKSTDDASNPAEDALLVTPALCREQAAAHTNTSDSSHVLRLNSNTEMASQSFTTTIAISELHSVVLRLAKVSAPTGLIWVEIRSDNGGVPSGTILATSFKKNIARLITTSQWVPFLFKGDQKIGLTNSTLYHIVLRSDCAIDGSSYAVWGRVTAGGYAGGTALLYDGSSWSGVGADAQFVVTGLPTPTTITLPSGYDETCLLGYVRTSADASEFISCGGRDREYIERGVISSSSDRFLDNPTDLIAIWHSDCFGVSAATPSLGVIPYRESMVLSCRAYGTAAALNFGIGGEDATDMPAAIPTTYVEDSAYFSSAGSTIVTPEFEIPTGRSAGAHVSVSAGSGSLIYRNGFRW